MTSLGSLRALLIPAVVALLLQNPSGAIGQDSAGDRSETVWEGVYALEQAERGEAAFLEHCAGCHGEDLTGEGIARALRGAVFMERWREYDLDFLFTLMATEMPPAADPRVSEESVELGQAVYLDILAHVLRANGFPAGTAALDVDSLERIRIVGRDGPEPVPNFSLVRVVGCLALVGESRWTLVSASEPARARSVDGTTPEELEDSRGTPFGNLQFRLVNYTYIAQDFTPEPYRGQRIQVKGFLIRQPDAERINVTSLVTVEETCRP